MKKNSNLKIIIFYIVLIAAVILALTFMFNPKEEEQPGYSDIVSYFKDGRVTEFVVGNDNVLTMKLISLDDNGEPKLDANGNKQTETVSFKLHSVNAFVNDCQQYYDPEVVPTLIRLLLILKTLPRLNRL